MNTKNDAKVAISPIEFTQNQNGENINVGMAPVQGVAYSPTVYQNDVCTGYYSKINYELQKRRMDLEYQDISYQKKLRFEEEKKALNIRYQNYLKLMSVTVYKDSAGDIVFSILDSEKRSIASKKLLGVMDYSVKIFVTYYPQEKKALEVSWAGDRNNSVIFPYDDDGIDPNVFLRRLKQKGVLLLVSGRTEKQAANALLAYSFMSADSVEIPNSWGWNRMGDGTWHYAKKNEITMTEVLSNDRFY